MRSNAIAGIIYNPEGWADAGPNGHSPLILEPKAFAVPRNQRLPGSNSKFDSSRPAAPGQNFAAIGGCHAGPEPMFPFSFFNRWMICSFHYYSDLHTGQYRERRMLVNENCLFCQTAFFLMSVMTEWESANIFYLPCLFGPFRNGGHGRTINDIIG